jgi:hypothetical protein
MLSTMRSPRTFCTPQSLTAWDTTWRRTCHLRRHGLLPKRPPQRGRPEPPLGLPASLAGTPVRCTTSASNPVTACIGTTNSATTPRSATPTQAGASGDGLQVIGRSRALLTGDAAGGLVPAVASPAVNDQHARQPPAT